jgi:hypothetical protein
VGSLSLFLILAQSLPTRYDGSLILTFESPCGKSDFPAYLPTTFAGYLA